MIKILEGNRLITEYMGLNTPTHQCEYHVSLDKLMPVIYKLTKDGHCIDINICKLDTICKITRGTTKVATEKPHTTSTVWECVVQAIKNKNIHYK